MAESDLQRRIESLGRRLLADVEAWEERTRADRSKAIDSITRSVGEQVGQVIAAAQRSREEAREHRRQAKAARRTEKRARELENASAVQGVAQVVIAVALIVFAAVRPDLWWLLFIAMALGLGGAKEIGLAGEKRRRLRAAEPAEGKALPEPAHEVDVACDQLLADLQTSPEAVRGFLQHPEKTVESLRSTCKALDARRKQLVAENAKGRLAQLGAQRGQLVAQRDAAKDPEARRKLDDALRSVDGQAAALEQLAAVTERVEGEYTSLLVLLQELKTRVAVAKSTGSDVQMVGLRESVSRLNTELGAISEAMEAVQRQDLAPVVDVAEPPTADAVAPRRERV